MQPIIAIVGKSKSGKTSLLECLIAELKRRGYKVAVIKHSSGDSEFDTANKDTWRFSQAGSEVSAISSAHSLAIFKQVSHDLSPQELTHLIPSDSDLILTEGFKQSSCLKIEVHRQEQGRDLVSPPHQLLAVVTDEPLEVDVPQFSAGEVHKVADLVEKAMLTQQQADDIDLLINGAYIITNPSIRNLLKRTLITMVSGLNSIQEIKSLRIALRRKT